MPSSPGHAGEGLPPAVAVYREFLLPQSETFVLNQARSLRHFEPVLVGRRRVPGLDLAAMSCELINPGGCRGALREVSHRLGRVPPGFARVLSRRRPLLLHAHFGPDALAALPLSRRLRMPMLVTFHGYDATRRSDLSSGLRHWRYARRLPVLMREAAGVLAVSEHVRRRLIELGFPEQNVRTHYIGVDTDQFFRAPRAEREPVVLAVGRFVEKKGFADLIDAMAEVSRAVPAARLVLIGTGPLETELRAQASRVAAVEFAGPLPAAEVRRWMHRARVLAVPSVTASTGDTEGLPITLLEGMASGLPPVATRHAGIPEAITDGVEGLLLDEHDPRGLARALIAALTRNELWDELSESSRRAAVTRFDLTRQTRVLEEIYAAVAFRSPQLTFDHCRHPGCEHAGWNAAAYH